ncbi:E3 ubiquitin-protein ligase TRIM71-like [Mya arenaria]|uniref:E3 ubiquitin-protein ligase TRIM71-like n=1 Tax=Mya arenaria TaxID=6604 RepID=UPI0022E4FA69|nr:E3 ubiquitin-protein ligase TRIM71-like [Mya arenaria]
MESKLCDPCRFDETEEKATGFCLDCVEYLCSACSRDHRKNKITRTHTILKDEDMPSDVSTFASMKTMTKCKVHPDRTVEYKCSTHDELICVSCFAKAHRQCQTIDELTVERTEKQLQSVAQQTKRLQKEIQEVGDARLRMKQMLKENLVNLERFCDKHAAGMKERIDTLNDKLKENICSKIGGQVSSNEGDVDAVKSLQNELSEKIKLVNDTQKYGNANEQEAVFRRTENNLKEIESQVQSFQRKQSILYKVLPDPNLEKLSDLGQIHELDAEEMTVLCEQEIASCSSEEVVDDKNKERLEKDWHIDLEGGEPTDVTVDEKNGINSVIRNGYSFIFSVLNIKAEGLEPMFINE